MEIMVLQYFMSFITVIQYNVDTKSCVALGKLSVATFVEAPFGDGK